MDTSHTSVKGRFLGVWVSAFTLGLGRYGHMAALLPSPQAPLGVYYLLKRKKQGNVPRPSMAWSLKEIKEEATGGLLPTSRRMHAWTCREYYDCHSITTLITCVIL